MNFKYSYIDTLNIGFLNKLVHYKYNFNHIRKSKTHYFRL